MCIKTTKRNNFLYNSYLLHISNIRDIAINLKLYYLKLNKLFFAFFILLFRDELKTKIPSNIFL